MRTKETKEEISHGRSVRAEGYSGVSLGPGLRHKTESKIMSKSSTKRSRSRESVSRRSSEPPRAAQRTAAASGRSAASSLDDEQLLIPDEWDLRKASGHGSGKATPGTGGASPERRPHTSMTEVAPPEDVKASVSEKSVYSSSRNESAPNVSHSTKERHGPTHREHGSMEHLWPELLNEEEEPSEAMVPKEPIRVLVTAVTTELSYLMLVPLVRGDVFGLDQPIVLHLYDESENISDMHGIAMEMEDCSFGLLKQVVYTGEDEVAFLNVDVAFLNDSLPVDGGRAEFVKCVRTYVGHGKALSAHAKKTVKVIVSGYPIETNTYLCNRYAKSIPHENFTGLARLNHNRAVTLLSQKLGVIPNKIINMIVWGRGGDMLYPDYSRCVVTKKARRYNITDQVPNEYLEQGLPEDVRIREQLVQKLTRHPGLLSRAKAACDQMRDWWIGLAPGTFVTMTVQSDGLYGVAPDVFFSYPVFIDNERTWKVVQGITVDERLRKCIADSSKEIERERDEAMEICTELGL
ncbi:hypothetical protein HPB48_004515 [Haemaphysalis longicornis]|uniref:Lactate/malate dehydrogenase C-terminal domain-containing protein n=1 Tax=Haemaphysalis longicornis TaxID=44386 RepID=A0A9J6G025_HAELO|nr:hypothetical protein HPB48_004515 [Haemaphysalis longicornis]